MKQLPLCENTIQQAGTISYHHTQSQIMIERKFANHNMHNTLTQLQRLITKAPTPHKENNQILIPLLQENLPITKKTGQSIPETIPTPPTHLTYMHGLIPHPPNNNTRTSQPKQQLIYIGVIPQHIHKWDKTVL